MTNHEENTRDESVAEILADTRKRPSRTQIVVDAVLLGLMAGVLFWLIQGQIERPTTWGRVGVIAYTLLTGWYVVALVRVLRRRWTTPEVERP